MVSESSVVMSDSSVLISKHCDGQRQQFSGQQAL